MSDLSATIRLRPTRIAFLVRPTNLPAIRTFMRICACLWGGAYNPIIPVFRSQPEDWRPDIPERLTGAEIARGYVEFFEPDAFVEADSNLLEKIGLGAIRDKHGVHERIIPLEELLACQSHHDWSELAMGLGVIDVLKHVYETEQRFELRDKHPACLVKPNRGTAFVEAMFGVYPTDKPSDYIARAYRDVFKPKNLDATSETWLKVYTRGAVTPLRLTAYKLEANHSWRHDPVFYVFDPAKSTDLIDLWNLRLEPKPLRPIPIDWWPDLADEVGKAIVAQHRPLQGNPHDVMHRTTIEFARSIDEARRKDMLAMLNPDLPRGSWAYKTWRTRIWKQYVDEHIVPTRPLRITAQEKRITLAVRDNHPPIADFRALAPDFASLYGGGHHARWVNVVNLSAFRRHDIATVLPFNVTDPTWPRVDHLGERVVVGTEGWSFAQIHKESTETIQLQTQEEAVIGSLKQLGVEAHLSEPGRIAKQVLHHLGGTWGIHLLADSDTLKLLNEMAGGVRKRGKDDGEIEEVFGRRSRSAKQWQDLIARRRERRPLPEIDISHFTDRNVLRLGLTTTCPHCTAENWHSLTVADYEISCERCLERYPFPQGALRSNNGNWSYRVIGPFSAPDYARGSYGALLALNVLYDIGFSHSEMTFSPALELRVDDGSPCEADYVAWISSQSMGETLHPELVIGEAKSLGDGDLIKLHDLTQLRRIAKKLPGATIVISVMRDEFTEGEKSMLLPFVKWTRRLDKNWEPTNPVILLTGVELFYKLNLSSTWKDKGGRHAKFASYEYRHRLRRLAEATQAIYLDLPSFSEDQEAALERRRSRFGSVAASTQPVAVDSGR